MINEMILMKNLSLWPVSNQSMYGKHWIWMFGKIRPFRYKSRVMAFHTSCYSSFVHVGTKRVFVLVQKHRVVFQRSAVHSCGCKSDD